MLKEHVEAPTVAVVSSRSAVAVLAAAHVFYRAVGDAQVLHGHYLLGMQRAVFPNTFANEDKKNAATHKGNSRIRDSGRTADSDATPLNMERSRHDQ